MSTTNHYLVRFLGKFSLLRSTLKSVCWNVASGQPRSWNVARGRASISRLLGHRYVPLLSQPSPKEVTKLTRCDSSVRNKIPFLGHFVPGLAMAPLLDLSAQDNDDSSGPEEPEPTVQAPRGKHLWCQEDSYGYTKGTDNLITILIPMFLHAVFSYLPYKRSFKYLSYEP